jgi:hypothetical protein
MVKVPMSPRQEKAIRRLDAEDCTGVIRLTKKEQMKLGNFLSDEYYEQACIGLKQYYALCVFDPINMHAISETLDPFWHSHILDTMRYAMLCDALGGFMHHDPLDHADIDKVEAVGKIYEHSYRMICKIFGEENADPRFHPKEVPLASMVCRHDLEPVKTFDDVFPEALDLSALREKYGHQAQRKMLAAQLQVA